MNPGKYWEYIWEINNFFNRQFELTNDSKVFDNELYEAVTEEIYRLAEPEIEEDENEYEEYNIEAWI